MGAGYGAYGKIPALGDFFRLNLSPAFVDPWDRWLQAAMADAAAALRDAWEDAYMSAPPWCFTLPPGLAGPQAASGVLVPSIDRVGRKFPLSLVLPLPRFTAPETDHAAFHDISFGVEELALDAVTTDLARDALSDRLADLPAPPASPVPMPPARRLRLTGRSLRPATGPTPPGAALWSCTGPAGTTLISTDGLPAQGLLALLFDPQTLSDDKTESSDA